MNTRSSAIPRHQPQLIHCKTYAILGTAAKASVGPQATKTLYHTVLFLGFTVLYYASYYAIVYWVTASQCYHGFFFFSAQFLGQKYRNELASINPNLHEGFQIHDDGLQNTSLNEQLPRSKKVRFEVHIPTK